ncbi:DUF3426 domain-containing protein [Cupriavidus pauculus]|uniref:Zinc finger/thioredoxin putative domain-containing protein n=1 Tax=Cupriavidus pauculus TaxID=82633 RepID=A0A2N5CGE7_9BURK|nr:DUF3426 domain-containing protein [Cupriavidus pauculus]PLQ01309.1 hypothetical protein CYJ10_06385 [Cupriavidus pauculus]
MAAAKLVTRCPACRTAFRLVADQLRLRQGLVRCGQCDTVFDAREHLIEVPAPAATSATATAPAVTMAAALAHAEQTQATTRAREDDTPFHPGFDPGYEVPALDSPTTMMSEPSPDEAAPAQDTTAAATAANIAGDDRTEAAVEPAVHAEAAETVAGAGAASTEIAVEPDAARAISPDTTETTAFGTHAPEADEEPVSEALTPAPSATAPKAAAETPLTEPPAPWPMLNHSAFDDEPVPAQPPVPAPHSSLDPAAAFAPPNPSGMPPYGAYSARATWPPLRPADAPSTRPMPEAAAAVPDVPDVPETAETGLSQASEATPDDARAEVADAVSADELPDLSSGTSINELPTPEPFPQADPVPSASGFLRVADPADPEADAWAAQAKDVIEHDLGVTLRDGTPDAVARETTTRHWLNQHGASATSASTTSASPASGPVFAPDFLRHTREREQARAPSAKVSVPGGRRTWLRAAAVVLGLGILVQGVYLTRSQIAGSMPVLRPVLEAACAPFGCEVPPWRDLDALRIDSSQLQKQDEASDVYLLAVALRNQGRATTALPAIELVMTDLQDQLLLRRVLLPGEYLEPAQRGFAATGLRAGSELPVRVRFRTQQAAANYRVLIFYP